MTEYALYLESGPRRRKTMVHVPALLGCIANGPTTEDALAATPDAIRHFLRFLRASADPEAPADPDAPFTTAVAEHLTQGEWMGNGSGSFVFATDLAPLTEEEIELCLLRFHSMRETLTAWAQAQSDAALDAMPADGRTARAILFHILEVPGAYLSAALGGAPGFSRVQGQVERGELPLIEGLRRIDTMAAERVRATTAEERAMVRERPNGDVRTLRKAIRRIMEHDWEHLASCPAVQMAPRSKLS